MKLRRKKYDTVKCHVTVSGPGARRPCRVCTCRSAESRGTADRTRATRRPTPDGRRSGRTTALPVRARATHYTRVVVPYTRFNDSNLLIVIPRPLRILRKDPEAGARRRCILRYVLLRLRALRFSSRFISSASRTALRRVPRMPLSAPAILQGPAWCRTWKPPVAYAHQPFRVLATRRPPICYCGS